MNDTKRDDHLPGEEEEERISDEAELDDFNDEEPEPSACPICREDYCHTHLLAAVCNGETDVWGHIDDAWQQATSSVLDALRHAFLNEQSTTSTLHRFDELLHQLIACDEDASEEGFEQACSEIGTAQAVRDILISQLYGLPGVRAAHYVHSGGMPGLSSSGTNFYARDPKDAAEQWLNRVTMPGPAVRGEPKL